MKVEVEEYEIMSELKDTYTDIYWPYNEMHICCRAPLAGVGEDWVEIVIPHQVSSSSASN